MARHCSSSVFGFSSGLRLTMDEVSTYLLASYQGTVGPLGPSPPSLNPAGARAGHHTAVELGGHTARQRRCPEGHPWIIQPPATTLA